MAARIPTKFNRKHQELLMYVMLFPEKTQRETARELGYSESWVSTIVNSDTFQSKLKELTTEFTGAVIVSLREKARAVQSVAMDRLMERVTGVVPEKTENLTKVVEVMDRVLKESDKGTPPAGPPGSTFVFNNVTSGDLADARASIAAAKANTPPRLPLDSDIIEGELSHGAQDN